jgi:hypothetical protein
LPHFARDLLRQMARVLGIVSRDPSQAQSACSGSYSGGCRYQGSLRSSLTTGNRMRLRQSRLRQCDCGNPIAAIRLRQSRLLRTKRSQRHGIGSSQRHIERTHQKPPHVIPERKARNVVGLHATTWNRELSTAYREDPPKATACHSGKKSAQRCGITRNDILSIKTACPGGQVGWGQAGMCERADSVSLPGQEG